MLNQRILQLERFKTPVLHGHGWTRLNQMVWNMSESARCPILQDFPPGVAANNTGDTLLDDDELADWHKKDCIIFQVRTKHPS